MSVTLTGNVSSVLAYTVWLLIAVSTGAVFARYTTAWKLLVADNCGTPLSRTITEIVFVLGACAGVGVQLNTPPVVMLAPAGAPAPRLKVSVCGG